MTDTVQSGPNVDTSAKAVRGGVALLRASMTPLLHSERLKMADLIEALAAERDGEKLRADTNDEAHAAAMRCVRLAEAERDRLAAEVEKMREGLADLQRIMWALLDQQAKHLLALGLNPDWSQVPSDLMRKHEAALAAKEPNT